MKLQPLVYILIPVYSGWNYTERCLDSLRSIKYKNYKIIIINDGSTDKTSEKLKRYYPEVKEVRGNGKLWWSGAMNKGITHIIKKNLTPAYILTLNNDVLVDPYFLSNLVEFCEKKKNCIAGSKILYENDRKKIWMFGAGCRRKDGITVQFHNYIDSDEFKKNKETDTLTGMSVLIPFSIFKKHHFLWDAKNLPMYFGDSDFVLRAKKIGFRSFVIGKSKIYAFPKNSACGDYKKLSLLKLLIFINSPKSYFKLGAIWNFYYRHFGLIIAIYHYILNMIKIIIFIAKQSKSILFIYKRKLYFKWLKSKRWSGLDINFNKNIESNTKVDVFIPVIEKDLDTLSLVIDSIKRNFRHPINEITIISNDSKKIINMCNKKGCKYVKENLVAPIKKGDIIYKPQGLDRSGWIFQQLFKLNLDTIVSQDNYLIIDADTVLIRPQILINDEKTIFNNSDEYHRPYFHTYAKLIKNKAKYPLSFTSHYVMYNKQHVSELKKIIESNHKKSWYQAIIDNLSMQEESSVSEQDLYCNYVYSKHKNEIIKNYWFNLNLKRNKIPNSIITLEKKYSRKYKSVSFHAYNK